MSVVGFDLGNANCFIAVARQGGIEVITNDYSLHATPSCVQFDDKTRVAGVAARQKMITKLKHTIAYFKPLIGRKYDDPVVEREKHWIPCPVVKMADGGVGLEVANYLGEKRVFTPEQALAMVLHKLRSITEHWYKEHGALRLTDCVMSVPSYTTQAQRQAYHDATRMVGLNCLKLINETTATALAYGIYKQDLPADTEKPRKVLFIDVGHAQTQMSIVNFNKTKLSMCATVYDDALGGRDLDAALRNYFADDFAKNFKIDVRSSPRAWFRLLDEAEKIKKQMSANSTKLPLAIECFMDDKDVKSYMQRADFEALCEPFWHKFRELIVRLLHSAKTGAGDIDVVEMVGGSSRVPKLKAIAQEVIGKEPRSTMNMDEAVARGAAMQCAIKSPTARVREFALQDVQPYSITLQYPTTDGNTEDMEVFPEHAEFPFSKMLTFHKTAPFTLSARYTHPNAVPCPDTFIGRWTITGVTPTATGESRKVKTKFRINSNGLFEVSSASAVETVEVPVEKTPTPVKDDKAAEEKNGDDAATNGEENMDTEAAADGKPAKTKKKTITNDLPVKADTTVGYDEATLRKMQEMEADMQARDRAEQERSDAKNDVEEYVYNMRDKISDAYAKYITEQDAADFSSKLSATEEWLYDEGEDLPKADYVKRLAELRAIGDPVSERARESELRAPAFERLARLIQQTTKTVELVDAKDAKYEHLEAKEVDKVRKALEQKHAWLEEMMGKQNIRPPTEPPVVFAAQIDQEAKALDDMSRPILFKPKPKPKVEQPPPPPKEDAKASASEGTEEAHPAAEGGENGMDVDA